MTIHDAQARNQKKDWSSIQCLYPVVNEETGAEVVRFDLAEDYSIETAMVFGEVYKHNGEWKFRAMGQGYAGGSSYVITIWRKYWLSHFGCLIYH